MTERSEPFEDDERVVFEDYQPNESPRQPIRPTLFVWRDPATMPPRDWIYGRHLIRRYVSATFSPGAVGKSSLAIVEALAMVTGRPLLGTAPKKRLSVWYINLEDPLEETEKRVMAACLHYEIEPEDIEGRLFLDSGRGRDRDNPIVIATETRNGARIVEPVVTDLIDALRENDISVLIVDPFVSSHQVSENDNSAIDMVAKCWNRVAEEGGAAVELIHHVRKGQAGQGEYTVEDGRGAGALLAAARSARVLNPMSKVQSDEAGLPSPRSYFRADNGKSNLAPPPEGSTWFKMESVSLGNGGTGSGLSDLSDYMGVVTTWKWPDAMESVTVSHLREVQRRMAQSGPWRESVQSPEWVGNLIAEVMGLDASRPKDRTTIKVALKAWMANGMFKVKLIADEARRERKCVVVGERATD